MAIKSGKKYKSDPPIPGANEPLEHYFASKKFLDSFRNVEISTLSEQEEANYEFWLSLTPEQRLELHYEMIVHFFHDELKKMKKLYKPKLFLTDEVVPEKIDFLTKK